MNIHRPFSVLFLITLTAGLLIAVTEVAAGPLKVKSADPNSGVVGETPIVTIKGVGFTNANKVRFLVNKSNSDTGNVVVTFIKVLDDETLTVEANLNGATVADYDIEVQLAGGRKGKGTTLFSVKSKNGGGGTGSTLTAVFCLDMDVVDLNPGLARDRPLEEGQLHDYCDDRKERVMIGTGSHPGFRFDSNTKNRPPLRLVQVNVLGGEVDVTDDSGMFLSTFTEGKYQIDLRFNKGNGGLDLGGMDLHSEGGPEYFVPVNVYLDSLDGLDNRFGLAYSKNTDPLSDGRLAGNACIDGFNTLDAQVKRLGPGTWSIESNPVNATACLWDLNEDLYTQATGTLVQMPFYIEIEIK